MIYQLALLALGVYLGLGIAAAIWFHLDDYPGEEDYHWLWDLLLAVVVVIIWGPVTVTLLFEESLPHVKNN